MGTSAPIMRPIFCSARLEDIRGDWRALLSFVTASLRLSRLTSISLELVLYLRAVGARARRCWRGGARGVAARVKDLQGQIKDDRVLRALAGHFSFERATRLLEGCAVPVSAFRRAGADA